MTGRKRKPLERQIAEGDKSRIGKRKLEEKSRRVPRPSRGLLACPDHLKGRAREMWVFWAAELEDMQLDARCDVGMLEGACVNYARAVEADIRIAKEGIVVREDVFRYGKVQKGIYRIKKHPAVTVSSDAWSQVRSFCSEFGLSPAARVRLAVAAPSDPSTEINATLYGPTLTDEEKRKLQ